MTFLNPFILFGLIASTIPVIIHILNLRKLKKIEFSSLQFLKELQKNKIRKIKLKQILLLIIRTLIIILIVFAFSRPVIKEYLSGFGSHAKSSIVIILDDSYSMDSNDENGNYFKQAKESAIKILDLLEEGDDVSIIRTSQLPEITEKSSQNFNSIKKELLNYKIGYKYTDFVTAFNIANQILSESKNFNKEIYLITDNQKTNYKNVNQINRLFNNNIKLYIIDIGSKSESNSAITNIEIINKIFEKNTPINIKVTIDSYGELKSSNAIVSIYSSGKRVTQKNVDLKSGTIITELSFIPNKTGFIDGFVELEDDNCPIDNRRYFSFYIPERINLLLTSQDEKDNLFLELALSSFSTDSLSKKNETFFNLTTIKNSNFSSKNITGFDAIIINGLKGFSSGDINRLKAFLHNGGGLILYSGKNDDITEINTFMTLLGLLKVKSIDNFNSSFISFNKVDFEHPIFQGIFENKFGQNQNKKEIESPQIIKNVNYELNNNALPVVTLSNNFPFLIDYSYEKSKILIFSVSPIIEFSDFPFKGIFIPLTFKSILYVSNKYETGSSILVGDIVDINFPFTGSNSNLILKYPDNNEEKITVSNSSNGVIYHFTNSKVPGIFTINSSNEVLKMISVNLSPEESDLTKIEKKELDNIMDKIKPDGYKYMNISSNIIQTLEEARYGIELWKTLLFIALILVIIEMLLSKDSKKELIELKSQE
ncbi:MAG TPA: BatA domain-containing protein [Ignavibacteria bacterium]